MGWKLLISLLCFFVLVPAVEAKTVTSGDLEVTFDEPLFAASTIWYPGLSQTKSILVKNNGGSTHTVITKAENTSQTGNLANIITFRSQSLKEFWDSGEVTLSDLSGGASSTYDFPASMLASAGNEYQGKYAKFDLVIGFKGTDDQVTVTNSTTSVCNDVAPSSAPVLTSAVAGENSVTLIWTVAGNPVTYYLVTYGESPGAQTYGNPNVGGAGTTSYMVGNLSGGVTYYFRVRAGNGCTPGPFSNELSATPYGGLVEGIATEFVPEVLGETPASEEIPEVKGEAISCFCIWWQLLVVQVVLILLKRKKIAWSLVVSLVIFLAFLYLNRFCPLAGICRYFWLLDLGVLLLLRLLVKMERNENS